MNQKNHVRRAALALAGALTLGVLSGCGGAPAKAPQPPDAGESAGYDPVTLDNYGREITISQRPERVLTSSTPWTGRSATRAATWRRQPSTA